MLNNRELALILYGLVGIVVLRRRVAMAALLGSIPRLLRRGFTIRRVGGQLGIIAGWATVVGLIAWQVGVLNSNLVRPAIYWCLFCALPLVYHGVRAETDSVRQLFAEQVTLIVFLTFIINSYVFSFLVEVVLVGILLFVQLGHWASIRDRRIPAGNWFGIAEAVLGFTVLAGASWKALDDLSNLASGATLTRFLAPIVLTFAFVPVVYVFALAAAHGLVEDRIRRNPHRKLRWSMRRSVFRRCRFSPSLAKRAATMPLFRLDEVTEVQEFNELLERYLSDEDLPRSKPPWEF